MIKNLDIRAHRELKIKGQHGDCLSVLRRRGCRSILSYFRRWELTQGIRVLKRSVLVKNKQEDCFHGRRVLGYGKVPFHRKCFRFDLVSIQYRYCFQGQKMS